MQSRCRLMPSGFYSRYGWNGLIAMLACFLLAGLLLSFVLRQRGAEQTDS